MLAMLAAELTSAARRRQPLQQIPRAELLPVEILDTQPDDPVLVLPLKRGEETLCVAIGAAPREAKVFEKTAHFKLLGDKLTDAVEIVRLRKKILAI